MVSMNKYGKEDLECDVDWLMAKEFDEQDAIDFCVNLSIKQSNLIRCASCGCVCELGTSDVINTTCVFCGGEIK
jgi:hypothetical protein